MNRDARIRSAHERDGSGDARGADGNGEHRMPVWIERLLQSHAPSLPLHRHRWFARDLHQFLAYCRSRGQDKLDLDLLAREYVETLRHSEPALETWKIEQARQALDVFARGVEGWRWEHDPEKGEWAPRFRIRSATEPKGGATEMGVSNGSTAATVPLIERMQLSCYVSQVQCVQDFSPAERASKKVHDHHRGNLKPPPAQMANLPIPGVICQRYARITIIVIIVGAKGRQYRCTLAASESNCQRGQKPTNFEVRVKTDLSFVFPTRTSLDSPIVAQW
jgi:hypothetical protein